MDFKPDAVELILKLKGLGFTLVLATMTTQVQLDICSKKNKKMLEQMDRKIRRSKVDIAMQEIDKVVFICICKVRDCYAELIQCLEELN